MTDTRPVLLGMNNPHGPRSEFALYPIPATSAGGRIQAMSGLSRRDYLERFDRQNVLATVEWDAKRARLEAPIIRKALAGRIVIALGAAVNSVMRGGTEHELAPPFRWTPDGAGGWIAKAPHPSGRSTFYNDPLHRELLRIFLEETLAWQPEPSPISGPSQGVLL